MVQKKLALVFLVGLCLLVQQVGAQEAGWRQFRGPNGDAVAEKGTPLTSWDESNYLWQAEIPGTGWSSPVYQSGRIWLTTAITAQATAEQIAEKRKGVQFPQMKTTVGRLDLHAVCIDLENGKLLHNIQLASVSDPGLINPLNSYASPTPAIEDGKVVCHYGNYGTWCLDAETGKEIWRTQFVVDHSVGAGSSPVIHDGNVILVCDGVDEQFIAAVSLESGETKWKTQRPEFRLQNGEQQKAYSTPLIAEIAGKTQAIIPGAQWVIAYNVSNGEEIWRVDHGDGFSVTPMASIENGLVVFSTGFMRPEFVAIDPTGAGDITKTHVKWRVKQAPSMPSMVSANGKLFAVTDKGIVSCIDVQSGEVINKKRVGGNFSASPLLAGGNIYFCSRSGDVSIIKSDETLKDMGKQKFDGKLMASPVPVGDDLLIRTDKRLYRIGKKSS